MEPLGKREREIFAGGRADDGGTKTVLIIIGKFPSILFWILKYCMLNRQFSSLSLHPPHPQPLFYPPSSLLFLFRCDEGTPQVLPGRRDPGHAGEFVGSIGIDLFPSLPSIFRAHNEFFVESVSNCFVSYCYEWPKPKYWPLPTVMLGYPCPTRPDSSGPQESWQCCPSTSKITTLLIPTSQLGC